MILEIDRADSANMIRLALLNGLRVFVTAEGQYGYCREISRYRQHEDGALTFLTEDREYYRFGDPGLTWTITSQTMPIYIERVL